MLDIATHQGQDGRANRMLARCLRDNGDDRRKECRTMVKEYVAMIHSLVIDNGGQERKIPKRYQRAEIGNTIYLIGTFPLCNEIEQILGTNNFNSAIKLVN